MISCTVSYTEMNGSGTAAQLVTNARILEDGSPDSLEHNFHFRNIDSFPLNYTFLLKSTFNAFRIQLKEQTIIPKNKLNPPSGGDSKQLFIALSFVRPLNLHIRPSMSLRQIPLGARQRQDQWI